MILREQRFVEFYRCRDRYNLLAGVKVNKSTAGCAESSPASADSYITPASKFYHYLLSVPGSTGPGTGAGTGAGNR